MTTQLYVSVMTHISEKDYNFIIYEHGNFSQPLIVLSELEMKHFRQQLDMGIVAMEKAKSKAIK